MEIRSRKYDAKVRSNRIKTFYFSHSVTDQFCAASVIPFKDEEYGAVDSGSTLQSLLIGNRWKEVERLIEANWLVSTHHPPFEIGLRGNYLSNRAFLIAILRKMKGWLNLHRTMCTDINFERVRFHTLTVDPLGRKASGRVESEGPIVQPANPFLPMQSSLCVLECVA